MKVHYSTEKDTWETPPDLFAALDATFNFTLDPCAEANTAKCTKFFTKEDDGLNQSWQGERVFMNPPYGREIIKWIKKAYYEAKKGSLIVCLLPARTDTKWFHEYCIDGEIRFIKGRLRFSGCKDNAPFPNMIVMFYGPLMNFKAGAW